MDEVDDGLFEDGDDYDLDEEDEDVFPDSTVIKWIADGCTTLAQVADVLEEQEPPSGSERIEP